MSSKVAKIVLIVGLLLVSLMQGVAIDEYSTKNIIIMAVTWLVTILIITGLIFNVLWALRILAGLVFMACLLYLLDQIFYGPLSSGSQSKPSLSNAILVTVIFGMPSIIFAIKGDKWFGKRFKNEDKSENQPPK